MQFAYSPLAWGFLLVLVPLLIHLINLVRHKRTPWAAMEFLLESYRKNRRWVWLKQALLIASRMLAMALLVGMLAQWLTDSKMFAWMGRTNVHHYVILDDSASMHDSANNKSAYQNALGAIASISASAKQDSQNHLLSIFRTSKPQLAARIASGDQASGDPAKTNEVRADSVADLLAQTIPSDPSSILTKINSTQPTSIETSPLDSLDVVSRLIQSSEDQKSIVYVMSDFRTKDWSNPVTIRQRLQAIQSESVEIQLIDCVEARHENLSITSIEPRQEVLAAGVPTMVNVTVRNQGTTAARNVSVRVSAVDYSSSTGEPKASDRFSGLVTELPPLLFERIEPGESATRNVQVVFPKSGSHVVQAELPPDSITPDNQASCVLDIADGIRVLLVDGDAGGKHSYFFESALDPGGNARTGLLIQRERVEYLRDSDSVALENFACIILQSIPSLDPRALANLHRYVSAGGGLAIWFGDDISTSDYLRGYSNWAKPIPGADNTLPLSPFGLTGPMELTKQPGDATPDLLAESHPIFAPLLGLSNSPFQFVRVERYVGIDTKLDTGAEKLWKPVASLRNRDPLMVDYPLGAGRVLIALTSLDRRWSNWPQDPTFVVAALKMVGYLSSFKLPETSRPTGTALRWDFSAQEMLPETRLVLPATSARGVRPLVQINATDVGENSLRANYGVGLESVTSDAIRALTSAGIFEWWGTSIQGDAKVKNSARNTPGIEGDTDRVTPTDLARNLSGVKFNYRSALSNASDVSLAGLSNRNMLLLGLLVALLLAEQWLAWSTSYHLPKRS
ncbi:MAG: BatA domain-containing protein [Planctomycetota bacterium]